MISTPARPTPEKVKANSFMKALGPEKVDYLIALAGYFLIALFILHVILLSPGTIGFFHDWPIGPYPEMNNRWGMGGFYIWDSMLGNKIYPVDWVFLVSLLPFSFLGGEFISKGLLLFVITLSGFSAFCLSKQLKLSSYSSFAAGILYIFSAVVFTRIVAGYIYYLTAYSVTPLILSYFLKGKDQDVNKNKYFIIAGLIASFAVAQLQFILLILIILLVFSFISIKSIRRAIIGLLTISLIVFLVNISPVLLSQIFMSNETGSTFNAAQLLSYHEIISASDLLKSFRLLGYNVHPYSYENLALAGIIPSWVFYLNFIFPIIGFSALFWKNKYVASFAIIALFGLFLLKGPNPPFPNVFSMLFDHGLYIFREIWHIAFLYGFSLTFMAAFFLDKVRFKKLKYNFNLVLPSILVVLVVVSNGYPLLTGNFAGYLQTFKYPPEYQTLYNNISNNNTHNTLILPYISPIHFDGLKLEGIDPIVRYSPSHILHVSPDPSLSMTGFSTWLLSVMQENKTENLGKLLSGFGINEIILRKDFVSNYPNYVNLGEDDGFRKKWYTSIEPILDAQKDLVVTSNTTRYKIYENTNNATKIFSPKSFASGLSDFNSLLLLSNFTSLSNVSAIPSISNKSYLVFTDDKKEIYEVPSSSDFIDLGKYTSFYDARQGWTDNRNWFGYDYLLSSRIHRGAFTSLDGAILSFELPSKYQNLPVELWIKALTWHRGGKVEISINGEKSSQSLFSSNQSMRLFKIFEGISNVPFHISIKNIGGENYIEGLYIVEDKSNKDRNNLNNKIFVTGIEDERRNSLLATQDFMSFDNQSHLSLYWNDSEGNCLSTFKCTINSTTGWEGNSSLQISTRTNNDRTWSWIYGKEIDVNPNERYELDAHMKLNEFATQSHIVFEGFNQTSREWYQLQQCPTGINGPIDWHVFGCEVTIPNNTTKIRVALNAGWSNQPNAEAITYFDAISLIKLNNSQNQFADLDLTQMKKVISGRISQEKVPVIKEYVKVNPTLWKAHINASAPFTLAFAEPHDSAWEARIYKDDRKLGVAKSIPLYGAINAFQIDQSGDLEIEIRYLRQDWFEIGLLISSVTFSFCIFYLFYDWKRNKLERGLSHFLGYIQSYTKSVLSKNKKR